MMVSHSRSILVVKIIVVSCNCPEICCVPCTMYKTLTLTKVDASEDRLLWLRTFEDVNLLVQVVHCTQSADFLGFAAESKEQK